MDSINRSDDLAAIFPTAAVGSRDRLRSLRPRLPSNYFSLQNREPPVRARRANRQKVPMTVRKVYRYDEEDYPEGETITSRGDHFARLTPAQQRVETAIRKTLENGEEIRIKSLYTWENREVAEKETHLFELEIDDADVVHTDDLDFFSAAVDAIKASQSPEDAMQEYCSGKCQSERVEVLVKKAKVAKRLKHSSEH